MGQGDSILIEFPPRMFIGRKTMLIDGGPRSSSENNVVKFLNEKEISKLHFVVLTHPHVDHYQGLRPILTDFTVDNFIWTGEDRGESREENLTENSFWPKFETAKAKAKRELDVDLGFKRTSKGAVVTVMNAGH